MTRILSLSSLFFSIQVALAAYVNATLAKTIIGEEYVGLLYIASSFLALCALHLAPKIIKALGRKYTLYASLLLGSVGSLTIVLYYPLSISIVGLALVLVTNTLTYFMLDIILESYSNDASTGRTRGAYLSTMNIGWMIAPLIAGFVLARYSSTTLYAIICAISSLLVLWMIYLLRNYTAVEYTRVSLRETLRQVHAKPILTKLVFNNFVLQLFFSWMVIYSSLFLIEHYGFNWSVIGIMFTIMLSAFVLVEYPVGKMMDRGWKNYQIITLGFIFSGIGALGFAYGHPYVFFIGAMLFVSRIGAAMIESASEVTFFKHISGSDTHLLSLYRDMSPLAYIVGPVIAILMLKLGDLRMLFGVLGVIMIGYAFVVWKNRHILYEKENN